MNSPLHQIADAAADAVRRSIAAFHRDVVREKELRDAEYRARLAELDVRILSVADLERRVGERLASLKDGASGERGEVGPAGPQGERGEVGPQGDHGEGGPQGQQGETGPQGESGVQGERGESGPQGETGPQGEVGPQADRGEAGPQGARGEPGPIGSQGETGEAGPQGDQGIQGERGERGERGDVGAQGDLGEVGPVGPQGEPGIQGERGVVGERGEVGPTGPQGELGPSGPQGERGVVGERGEVGPQGLMPAARAWEDRVYYERDAVTHGGSLYQAIRPNQKEPPHVDWVCLIPAAKDGVDGRSFTIRGTFQDGESYKKLDVVVLDGNAFAATRDNPGPCPSRDGGWQLIAKQGKAGKPGDPGPRGLAGPPGAKVEEMTADGEGLLTVRNGDGSEVACDLYPLLAKLK